MDVSNRTESRITMCFHCCSADTTLKRNITFFIQRAIHNFIVEKIRQRFKFFGSRNKMRKPIRTLRDDWQANSYFLYVSQNEGSKHTFLLYFREFFFGAPILIIKMIQHYIHFRNSTTPFPNVLFETEFEWAFPINSMEFPTEIHAKPKECELFFTDYYYQNYKRSTGMKFWRMLHLKMSHCVGV